MNNILYGLIDNGICDKCHKKVWVSHFKNFDAIRFYETKGICQECQDRDKMWELKYEEYERRNRK